MILLDTKILIEIIRKNGEIIRKCDDLGTSSLAISSITRYEFLLGSRDKKSFTDNLRFVGKFQTIPINEEIDMVFSHLCEKYALSHRPSIPDMLIAATALHHSYCLYTLNTKDFRFLPDIQFAI